MSMLSDIFPYIDGDLCESCTDVKYRSAFALIAQISLEWWLYFNKWSSKEHHLFVIDTQTTYYSDNIQELELEFWGVDLRTMMITIDTNIKMDIYWFICVFARAFETPLVEDQLLKISVSTVGYYLNIKSYSTVLIDRGTIRELLVH